MWTSFFLALAKVFGFAEKAIPSDVIRNDSHLIRKPRIEANEREKILRQATKYLCDSDNWSLNIETYVNYTYDSLDVEDRNELIETLIEKVRIHKVVFSIKFPQRYKKIMQRINGEQK